MSRIEKALSQLSRALAAALLLLVAWTPQAAIGADSAEGIEEALARKKPFFLFYASHPRRGTNVHFSDGTAEGTKLLFDVTEYDGSKGAVVSMATLGRRTLAVVEAANDNSRTRPGLYVIGDDGSARRIVDRQLREALEITPLRVVGGRLYLVVMTYSDFFLYETDGRPAGTRRLARLPNIPAASAELDGRLLLLMSGYAGSGGQALVLDPGAGKLTRLFDFPRDGGWIVATQPQPGDRAETAVGVGPSGARILFWRQTPRFGLEPWVTDGTLAGTRQLANIGQGNANGTEGPRYFLRLGERALFIGLSRSHGSELWVTDGTAEGTRLLRDIMPGEQSAGIRLDQAVVLGDKAYFPASSGLLRRGLWVTDGTPAGTRRIALRHKGELVQPRSGGPRALAAVEGLLYFEGTRMSGRCPGTDEHPCLYESALYSYDPTERKLRRRAQTTDFACYFRNSYVAAIYAGGNYRELAAFDKGLFFAGTGQRRITPLPNCANAPDDEEPWLFRRNKAIELRQMSPGLTGSHPEFIGWSGCDGRC